jgi:hypothetical protein
VNRRVRLPGERELAVIADNGLHEALIARHSEEVRRALDALTGAIPGETISLELLVGTLAGLLGAQPGVRGLCSEVVALGGNVALDEQQLLAALARWVIDNQIGRGFAWDPAVVPARR